MHFREILTTLREWLLVCTACAVFAACAATEAGARRESERDLASIEATLEELYRAFCFDANKEADWETQRSLFASGAVFVAPFASGSEPRGVDGEQFLADFRAFILGSKLGKSGYHERIIHTRVDVFGVIAHAYVTFEGFVPGQAADRRGVDSLQLVRGPEGWLVASFTTQYETDDTPLPEHFLRDGLSD